MRWQRCAAAAGVAAALTMAVRADQGDVGGSPTSVWAGVYTTEQAVAGEEVYFAQCASCHGADLGGVERSPALAGPQFLDAWHGKDLRRLLDRVLAMPPGEPVSPAKGVEVLAFLLYASEMPSGPTALPADRARLAELMFERAKP
jgi:mono/diheme cytochrome c family protein